MTTLYEKLDWYVSTLSNMSASDRAACIIDRWGFRPVVRQALKDGMKMCEVSEALDGLKEFLYQCAAHPDIDISPQSKLVDDLWHAFIVTDTRAYMAFCNAAYGEYLHHDGTMSGASLETARANTKRIFGTVGEAVECNDARGECGRVTAKTVECGRRVAA